MEDMYAIGVGSVIPIDFQELKLQQGKILENTEVTVTSQEHPWGMKYEPPHICQDFCPRVSEVFLVDFKERNKGKLSAKGKKEDYL